MNDEGAGAVANLNRGFEGLDEVTEQSPNGVGVLALQRGVQLENHVGAGGLQLIIELLRVLRVVARRHVQNLFGELAKHSTSLGEQHTAHECQAAKRKGHLALLAVCCLQGTLRGSLCVYGMEDTQ